MGHKDYLRDPLSTKEKIQLVKKHGFCRGGNKFMNFEKLKEKLPWTTEMNCLEELLSKI